MYHTSYTLSSECGEGNSPQQTGAVRILTLAHRDTAFEQPTKHVSLISKIQPRLKMVMKRANKAYFTPMVKKLLLIYDTCI